jgi:hypothetical protein
MTALIIVWLTCTALNWGHLMWLAWPPRRVQDDPEFWIGLALGFALAPVVFLRVTVWAWPAHWLEIRKARRRARGEKP